MLRVFLILIFIVSVLFRANAKVTHGTSNGNWNSAGTWDNGVPACGDTIIVDKDVTVTVSDHVNLDETSACSTASYVEVSGTLIFNTGKKLFLACNSHVFVTSDGELKKGGGGGSANLINICQTTVWSSGDGDTSGPIPIGPGLPITLSEFYLEKQSDGVLIKWTTLSEINNDYFSVERSTNLKTFEEIERIVGAGDSRRELHYEVFDKNPLSGVSYYRLKQTDFNGNFEYGPLAVFQNESNFKQINVFPNFVTNNGISIEIKGCVQELCDVYLFTSDGRLLLQKQFLVLNDHHIESLDVSEIHYSGMAVMKVNTAISESQFKLKFE